MAVTLLEPVLPAPASMPPRKTWTREELDQLERSGVLDSAEYELVDGELFKRMPKKWPHRFALAF